MPFTTKIGKTPITTTKWGNNIGYPSVIMNLSLQNEESDTDSETDSYSESDAESDAESESVSESVSESESELESNSMSSANYNQYMLITKLLSSSVFININALLTAYSTGNFDYIMEHLSMAEYETLSAELYKLKDTTIMQYYETIRAYIVSTLEGLHQCVLQIQAQKGMENQYIIYKKGYDTLNDVAKLKEYLAEQQKKSLEIFPKMSITSSFLKLKPQYTTYIQLYGFPENGVYDSAKLAQIMLDLSL